MSPTLRDGDTVLVRPYGYDSPERGHVVLAWHPDEDFRIIKRIHQIFDDGSLRLIGDNPGFSTDSRSFGNVPRGKLIGRVVGVLVYAT